MKFDFLLGCEKQKERIISLNPRDGAGNYSGANIQTSILGHESSRVCGVLWNHLVQVTKEPLCNRITSVESRST